MWISRKRLDNMIDNAGEYAYIRAKAYVDEQLRYELRSVKDRQNEHWKTVLGLGFMPKENPASVEERDVPVREALGALMTALGMSFKQKKWELTAERKGGPESTEPISGRVHDFPVFAGDEFFGDNEGRYWHKRTGARLFLVPRPPETK